LVDDIQQFLDHSNKINGHSLSFTRFQILTLLAYFEDGLQYRELIVALKISDGKLISNLNILRKLRYVKKSIVEYDHKKLDIYKLTPEGRDNLLMMTDWVDLAEKVIKGDDQQCLQILTK
jgi:DNA-binding MarR family transcriptional regulator